MTNQHKKSCLEGSYSASKNIAPMDLQLFAEGDPPAGGSPVTGYSAEYVRQLRDENAGWRTKLREAEEENGKLKKQLETANQRATTAETQANTFLEEARGLLQLDATADAKKVSEVIKELAGSKDATLSKAQEALKKSAFMSAATKHGIDPKVAEDAYKLADLTKVNVDMENLSVFQVGDDGKQIADKDGKPVTGVSGIVEALVKEKPYLAGGKPTSTVGGGSNPGSGSGGGGKGDEGGTFGSELGKKAQESAKKQQDSQDLYFK